MRFNGTKMGVNTPSSLTKRVTVIQWLKRQKITKTIFGLTSFKPELGDLIFTKYRGHERVELLPLWAVRPVQSLSACTRVHFTYRDEIRETCNKQTIQDSSYKTTCKTLRRCSTWSGSRPDRIVGCCRYDDKHSSNYDTSYGGSGPSSWPSRLTPSCLK